VFLVNISFSPLFLLCFGGWTYSMALCSSVRHGFPARVGGVCLFALSRVFRFFGSGVRRRLFYCLRQGKGHKILRAARHSLAKSAKTGQSRSKNPRRKKNLKNF
jgi:hypothetical protein